MEMSAPASVDEAPVTFLNQPVGGEPVLTEIEPAPYVEPEPYVAPKVSHQKAPSKKR